MMTRLIARTIQGDTPRAVNATLKDSNAF
jgi:hypothetical protein